jgi:hypothetical protein
MKRYIHIIRVTGLTSFLQKDEPKRFDDTFALISNYKNTGVDYVNEAKLHPYCENWTEVEASSQTFEVVSVMVEIDKQCYPFRPPVFEKYRGERHEPCY